MSSYQNEKLLEDWRQSDSFAAFQNACKTNEPKEVLNSLMAWLGEFCKTQHFASIKQFSRSFGTTRLAEQLTVLREAIDSPTELFSGEDVYRAVEQAIHELPEHRSPTE